MANPKETETAVQFVPPPHPKQTDAHEGSHAVTFFCVTIAVVAAVLSAIFVAKRLKIAAWLRARRWTHWWIRVIEWVWAVAGAALGDYFEVFKPVSWSATGEHPYSAVFAVLSFGLLFLATGYVRDGVKESEEKKIA